MKQFFQQVDPQILDQYEWSRGTTQRRGIPLETVKYLSLLRRALQSLPPRELQFIYLQKSKRLVQEETRKIYSVQQQNISYRLNRASQRIALHYKLSHLSSETQLRRKLATLGLSGHVIRIVTGIVRTSSQAATSESLAVSPGSIRYSYVKALSVLEDHDQLTALKQLSGRWSDTEIRRRLIHGEVPVEHSIAVVSLLKGLSPRKVGETLGISEGEIRTLLPPALAVLGRGDWASVELQLLHLVARNLNQIRCTNSQERWAWKKERSGGGDRPYDGVESGIGLLIGNTGLC